MYYINYILISIEKNNFKIILEYQIILKYKKCKLISYFILLYNL